MRSSTTTIHYGLDSQSNSLSLLGNLEGNREADLVLLPNRFRKLNLADQLSDSQEPSLTPPFFTLREFIASLFREQAPHLRVLSELEKRSLLIRLGGGAEESSTPGRVAQLSRLLASIKSRNITDPELLRLKLLRESPDLPPDQVQVLAFFRRYQDSLSQLGYEDREGCYCQVHDALVTGGLQLNEIYPKVRRLIMELPVRLSPLEASIVSLLTNEFTETHLLVSLENPQVASESRSWSFLLKLESDVRIGPKAGSSPSIVAHPSERGELVWIADQVQQLLDTNGRGAAIGIATSLPGNRDAELSTELEARGVEVVWLRAGSSDSSAICSSILHYLRVLESGFARTEIFDFLAESRVDCGFSKRQLGRLEALAERAWVESCSKDQRSLLPAAGEVLGESLGIQQERVSGLIEVLSNLDLKCDSELSFQDWYGACVGKLQPFLRLDSLGGGEGRLLNQFREVVRRQIEICGSWPLPFSKFLQLFRPCLEVRNPNPQIIRSAVWAGAPEELQNCHFTHLFWCGMTEEDFPARVYDPLSEERTPGPFRTLSTEERFADAGRIYDNLTRCSAKVICSYPEQIADRGTSASQLLAGSDVVSIAPPESVSLVSPGAWSNIGRGRVVQASRESGRASSYLGFLSSLEARTSCTRTLWEGGIKVSPSLLESYAACGFRFFVQRLLNLNKQPAAPTGPLGADLGRLIHRILYRFRSRGFVDPSNCRPEAEPDWTRDQCSRMLRIATREIEALKSKYLWGTGLFWEHPAQRFLEGLGENDERGGLLAEFVRQEWKLGRRQRALQEELRVGPIPIGEIVDEDGRFHAVGLEGRLDRVDRTEHGLVVIDYKTGADARGRCYRGWGFQLPLYSILAANALDEPVSEAFFLALRFPQQVRPERLRMPREGRAELWEHLVEFYRRRALDLTIQLYRGYFPTTLVGPSQAGCRSCDYREICRFEGARSARLVRSGQLVAPVSLLDAGQWVGIYDHRNRESV